MKICKIYIKGFQQFQDVELNFTNPETGEPLDKVCFIGRNGTGKSKILGIVTGVLNYIERNLFSSATEFVLQDSGEVVSLLVAKFTFEETAYILLIQTEKVRGYWLFGCSSAPNTLFNDLIDVVNSGKTGLEQTIFYNQHRIDQNQLMELYKRLQFKANSNDLVVFSPSETSENGYFGIDDVPKTTVNEALDLFRNLPFYAEVSASKVNVFWKILVYNLRKRAEERELFENRPDNIVKTKLQLIKDFDQISPKILEKLDKVWDKILNKSGLYFDAQNANNPYQLNDNLKAYIKLRKTGETIKYNQLSTGIRNYIFRLGHIFSLYFNREIDRGFLLVDEPENSLFPDFLFDLVETYQEVIKDKRGQINTQMFFATHSPIIAAQFKPYERIILDWNDDATVSVRKGTAPEGDDPNDILKQDFGLREIMGTAGLKMWDEYLEIKNKLRKATSTDEKMELAAEFNRIGQLYNFPA